MKKRILSLLFMALLVILTACNTTPEPTPSGESPAPATTAQGNEVGATDKGSEQMESASHENNVNYENDTEIPNENNGKGDETPKQPNVSNDKERENANNTPRQNGGGAIELPKVAF